MRKLMIMILLLSVLVGCATATEPLDISETVTETAVSTTNDTSEQDRSSKDVSTDDSDSDTSDTIVGSVDEEETNEQAEPGLTPEEAHEALFTAIATQNIDNVRVSIAQGADVNKHRFGTKPLNMAAVSNPGNQEITETLFEAGAKLTMDAFHKAVANSSTPPELIQWWIDNGADIHGHDPNNREFTALIVAASVNNVEIGRVLLENGADINAIDSLGDPPISTSAYYGHLEFTQMLAEEGADINMPGDGDTGRTALDWAVLEGRDDVVDYLRSIDAVSADDSNSDAMVDSVDSDEEADEAEDLTPEEAHEALFAAISTQNVADVRRFIAQGADVNEPHKRGMIPLVMAGALEPANQEITEQLLEAGAELSLQAFHTAIANPTTSPELIQLWIDHGADIEEPNPRSMMFTALFVAASRNNVEVGRALLEKGADIHALDQLGDPVITTSAFFGHLEFTEMLVEEGADFNMSRTGTSTLTPLHFAVNQGYDNVAEYLRSIGAVSGRDETDEADEENEADGVGATATLTRTKISTTMLSENTGIEYPIDIFLPVDYDESAAPYPVIYATDGQWLSDRYDKVLFDAGVPAVLVSVHQGPEERRQIDFGFPGVEQYFPFFRDELMAMVEAEYNVSPDHRTLLGQSAGGAFVWSVILLQEIENPLFDQFLIVDHGYWGTWDVEYKEKLEARYATNPAMPGKLVFTGALLDWHYQPPDGGDEIVFNFTNEVNALEEVFRDMEFEALEISRFSYDVAHDNAPIPSFIDAVPIFFPELMSEG